MDHSKFAFYDTNKKLFFDIIYEEMEKNADIFFIDNMD